MCVCLWMIQRVPDLLTLPFNPHIYICKFAGFQNTGLIYAAAGPMQVCGD